MTEIAMPTSANLVQFSINLDEQQQVNRSEWTGRRKVTALPGAQRWTAKFRPHAIIEDAIKREWRAFLVALRGQANTFRLLVAKPQHGAANPIVAAGANAGATLPMTGIAPNTTLLLAGEYMTVPLPSGHHRAVMLTADLVANGVGQATAEFRPFLNEVPATSAEIETINPFILMALSDSEQGWTEDYGQMIVGFEAEEAL